MSFARLLPLLTFTLAISYGFDAASQTATQPAEASNAAATPAKPLRSPDVMYVPTPNEVVEAMLTVAGAGKGDVLYDLGSGDGRIPIIAVQKFGISRATGIEINPERIQEAQANLKAAALGSRVQFLNEDLFEANISDATIVTLYLLPALNVKLLPKLLTDLKPGTRIVSHAFAMGDWKPKQALNVGGRAVYFWVIPAKGTAEYAAASAVARAGASN